MNFNRTWRRFLLTALAISSFPVLAAPWIAPGNLRMRHSLQYLADHGAISSPVTTWPVMWAGVVNGLDADSAAANSQEYAYLQFERNWQAKGGGFADVALRAASETTLIRGFGGMPRDEGVASVGLEYVGDNVSGRLEFSMVSDPSDDDGERFDGSYLAAIWGNWVVGAGAIDRWWGPGWQSSLILSNNARPIPSVWLSRKDTKAFESRWLGWIGPWQLVMFAGQLESQRTIADAKILGARFAFRPVQGLEAGLSRVIQWGGDGQDQSATSFFKALAGDSNPHTAGIDISNELAGFDVRYGLAGDGYTLGVYAQAIGEDEAGRLPSKYVGLIGMDASTEFGEGSQRWFIENGNTAVGDILGTPKYDIAYSHAQYQSGYYYKGRNIGPSYGPDSQAVSVGMMEFFENGHSLSVIYTNAKLSEDNHSYITEVDRDISYFIPKSRDTLDLVSVNYERPFGGGWLSLKTEYTFQPESIGNGDGADKWQVFASWVYRI